MVPIFIVGRIAIRLEMSPEVFKDPPWAFPSSTLLVIEEDDLPDMTFADLEALPNLEDLGIISEDVLIQLGDMMGDGLHHEPDGYWIPKEYKRILRALGIAPKRKNKQ